MHGLRLDLHRMHLILEVNQDVSLELLGECASEREHGLLVRCEALGVLTDGHGALVGLHASTTS